MRWDLLRATLAERVGDRARAAWLYGRVAGYLVRADPELAPLRTQAQAGLARMR